MRRENRRENLCSGWCRKNGLRCGAGPGGRSAGERGSDCRFEPGAGPRRGRDDRKPEGHHPPGRHRRPRCAGRCARARGRLPECDRVLHQPGGDGGLPGGRRALHRHGRPVPHHAQATGTERPFRRGGAERGAGDGLCAGCAEPPGPLRGRPPGHRRDDPHLRWHQAAPIGRRPLHLRRSDHPGRDDDAAHGLP